MRIVLISFFVFCSLLLKAQLLESGPMLGHVTHREASVWIAVTDEVTSAELVLRKTNDPASQVTYVKDVDPQDHNALIFILPELEMNTEYEYRIVLNGEVTDPGVPTTFRTRELWEYRKAAPDLAFLFGSCSYVNDSVYDRPGKPYGQSMRIFETMAETKADFNLWNGDYLYFREADYSSRSGMLYRYSHARSIAEQRKILAMRPNYSSWDDHDYGPNDANSSFEFKDFSRELFMNWWANPSYGENGEGVYTKFSYSDCDFFLLDNRWFRDANGLPDSIMGKPNTEKKHFGDQQLKWLRNSLMNSSATFKFIVSGGQLLNKVNRFECLTHFPAEYDQVIALVNDLKIPGIVLLSGDRHHTELLKTSTPTIYPLYEFTCSPLSSYAYKLTEKSDEFNNPERVKGSIITENNYSRISVSGPDGNRILSIVVLSVDGRELWKHNISENELSIKRK